MGTMGAMCPAATLGVDDAVFHATMVLDQVRVRAYAEAIRRVVRPGDVVVDIGTGSGVLAVIAARAEARRVFAIERGASAHLARRVVDDNGLSQVVEVVRGEAREVRLPEPPTVLVSETMGNLGIDEGLLALYALLAQQCAPGFRVVPSRVEPTAALLADTSLADEFRALGDVAGVDLRSLRAPLAHRVLSHRLREADLASEPGALGSFRPGVDTLPGALSATLRATRRCEVNAIGGWFRAERAEGLWLDTGPRSTPTHWQHVVFPLEPALACEEGDVVEVTLWPRVLTSSPFWKWRVRRGTESRVGDAFSRPSGPRWWVTGLSSLPRWRPSSSRPSPIVTSRSTTRPTRSGACWSPPGRRPADGRPHTARAWAV